MVLFLLSFLLFVASLISPAFNGSVLGAHVLVAGWAGVFSSDFGWFANLFYLFSMIFFFAGKSHIAFSLVLFSLCLSIQTYFFMPENWQSLKNGGSTIPIEYLGLGYYFWTLSFVLMIAACASNERRRQDKHRHP